MDLISTFADLEIRTPISRNLIADSQANEVVCINSLRSLVIAKATLESPVLVIAP